MYKRQLEIHLLTVHRILRLAEKSLQGQVGVLTRMGALDVVCVVALLRVIDVNRVVVLHLVVDMVALRRNVPLPDQQRMHPNARTISELRRLAFYTKGEFTDIAHRDEPGLIRGICIRREDNACLLYTSPSPRD